MTEEGNWQTLKVDANYEINDVYPHQIRYIADNHIIAEMESNGYLVCRVNKILMRKHRLIAMQWIDNPDNLPHVDHINHNRTDNHIENLRWVSNAINANNRNDQTFVDNIPDEAIVVDSYNGRYFEGLYFHDNIFYKYNGINYVVKPKFLNKAGNYFICISDVTGKQRTITYPKFKRQYGLM